MLNLHNLVVPAVAILNVRVPNLREDEKELRIGEYQVNARISGIYAHVETVFTIHNDNNRTFEGELEFPLPTEGVVCGYAIDVNGVMTPGSVVEKEKARIAFENEVKRGVDPGLVEQIRGNAYRTRVYPIFAHKFRKIRIEYLTPLVFGSNGDAALYLPMPHTQLERRDVVISVDMPEVAIPQISGLGNRVFEQAQAQWRVESHETQLERGDDLLVGIPRIPNVLTNIEKFDDDTYFSVSIPAPQVSHSNKESIPTRWRLVWDASSSRKPSDVQADLELLKLLPPKGFFEIHVFRNIIDEVETFDELDELLQYIDGIIYDGGTNYSPLLDLAASPFSGMTVFFSDGFDTYSGALPEFGASSAAIVSSKLRDMSVLRHICGGHIVDLQVLTASQGWDALSVSQPAISSVHGEGIEDVLGIGTTSSDRLTILGRLSAPRAKITLSTTLGTTFEVNLQKSLAKEGKTIALAWASHRIHDLSTDAESHREELLALGRHFSIVSPVSSLIVFETLSQWLEYDIEPPKELHDIHQEWLKKRRNSQKTEEKSKMEWERSVDAEWQNRIQWWKSPMPQINKPRSGVFEDDEFSVPNNTRVETRGRMEDTRPRYRHESAMGGAMHPVPFVAQPVPIPNVLKESTPMPMMSAPMPMMSAPMPMRSAPMDDDDVVLEEVESISENIQDSEFDEVDSNVPTPNQAVISVKAWDSNMPYLQAINDVSSIFKGTDRLYSAYIKEKKNYGESPSFYLDCANLFFNKQAYKYAIRILSNLSELKLDDPSLLRVYAWRLREAGELDLSILILKKVLKLRSSEVVSWRDLANTYAIRAKKMHSVEDIEEALKCYKHAIEVPCKRSDAVYTAVVAIEEFNALLAWSNAQEWADRSPVIPSLKNSYLKNLDTDIRIVLMWDADDTDLDLHVLEPSGEEVYFSNNRSASGGFLSYDVRTGYGPEEYLHKRAPSGTYNIKTKYFASHQQRLTGPVTATVTVFTNWGRPNENRQTMTLRLEKEKDHVTIGKIDL